MAQRLSVSENEGAHGGGRAGDYAGCRRARSGDGVSEGGVGVRSDTEVGIGRACEGAWSRFRRVDADADADAVELVGETDDVGDVDGGG